MSRGQCGQVERAEAQGVEAPLATLPLEVKGGLKVNESGGGRVVF